MTSITDLIPSEFIKIFFITMIIATIIFNSSIIYITLSTSTMRTHANLYIESLSVVDLIVGTMISASVLTLIINGSVPYGWCLTSGYLELAMFTTGVFSLLALTFHRYTATFKYQHELLPLKHTVRKLIIVWLAGFLYATRYFIQIEVEKMLLRYANQEDTKNTFNDDEEKEETNFCLFFIEDREYDLIFRVIDFVVLFVIPVILMIFMYSRIYKELNKKHFQSTTIARTARNKRITKMLVTAVVIFIVCWLPYYVHEIIIDAIEFTIGSEGDKNAQLIVRFVTVVLALTNSIANPIVYGWMNKNFRKEIYLRFQRILTRFGPHNQVEPSTNNVPTTRAHQSTDDTNLSRLVNRSEEQATEKAE